MGRLPWSILCVDVQITTDDALSNYVLCIHKQEQQLPNCQYLSRLSPNGCVSHGHTARGIKEMRGKNDRGRNFRWGDTCPSNREMNSIFLKKRLKFMCSSGLFFFEVVCFDHFKLTLKGDKCPQLPMPKSALSEPVCVVGCFFNRVSFLPFPLCLLDLHIKNRITPLPQKKTNPKIPKPHPYQKTKQNPSKLNTNKVPTWTAEIKRNSDSSCRPPSENFCDSFHILNNTPLITQEPWQTLGTRAEDVTLSHAGCTLSTSYKVPESVKVQELWVV